MVIKHVHSGFRAELPAVVDGRVKFVRTFGNLTFLRIQDAESEIQIGLRGQWDNIPNLLDWIRVQGVTGFTKTGEKTIWAEKLTILAKCEGDLPGKFHGLKDWETIYQKPYLRIIDDHNHAERLIKRSKIILAIRNYLDSRGFIEIETPILSNTPSGADARPFTTHHNALGRDMYLRIATEVALKKAIVAGIPKVFEIGKIFRNEGIDKSHSPEFTSIEIYDATIEVDSYYRLIVMMGLVKNIYQVCKDAIGEPINPCDLSFPIYEYDDLVSQYGEDFDSHLIEPTFVIGQPIEQTPLCKAREDGKAQRFEFFANGYEIANAFDEVNTYAEQSSRIREGEDDGLLEALKYGMPNTAGLGIGIDRLVMWLTNTSHIRDVQCFPLSNQTPAIQEG